MADKKEKVLFSKEKIIKMQRYESRADLLSVLLTDGKQYELKDADKLIDDFMKKEAK